MVLLRVVVILSLLLEKPVIMTYCLLLSACLKVHRHLRLWVRRWQLLKIMTLSSRCSLTRCWQRVRIELVLLTRVLMPILEAPGPSGSYGALAANFLRLDVLYRTGA